MELDTLSTLSIVIAGIVVSRTSGVCACPCVEVLAPGQKVEFPYSSSVKRSIGFHFKFVRT